MLCIVSVEAKSKKFPSASPSGLRKQTGTYQKTPLYPSPLSPTYTHTHTHTFLINFLLFSISAPEMPPIDNIDQLKVKYHKSFFLSNEK